MLCLAVIQELALITDADIISRDRMAAIINEMCQVLPMPPGASRKNNFSIHMLCVVQESISKDSFEQL